MDTDTLRAVLETALNIRFLIAAGLVLAPFAVLGLHVIHYLLPEPMKEAIVHEAETIASEIYHSVDIV